MTEKRYYRDIPDGGLFISIDPDVRSIYSSSRLWMKLSSGSLVCPVNWAVDRWKFCEFEERDLSWLIPAGIASVRPVMAGDLCYYGFSPFDEVEAVYPIPPPTSIIKLRHDYGFKIIEPRAILTQVFS